jgi:guanylate kinase
VRKRFLHAALSLEELAERLSERNTETPAELQQRLAHAPEELAQKDWYDYLVINRQGHLQEAVDNIRAIILAEHCRTRPRHIEI